MLYLCRVAGFVKLAKNKGMPRRENRQAHALVAVTSLVTACLFFSEREMPGHLFLLMFRT